MSSEFPIYLPLRPAALPLAQRLAAWIELAGRPVALQLCATLPLTKTSAGVALGDFDNIDAWRQAGGVRLDPLDWPAMAAYLRQHWPLSTPPRTRFGVTPATAPLPGEIWSDGEGLALELAPPEWALLQRAQPLGWQLATAESCTAGGIAARIAALPGSSALLRQGYVVYSNAAKEEMLGVQGATLARHGAVSEAVVEEMLEAALGQAKLAVAVSGIAGPGGAVAGKPVGTVCLGWATREQQRICTLHFVGDRWAVQYAAGSVVLGGLLTLLAEKAGV